MYCCTRDKYILDFKPQEPIEKNEIKINAKGIIASYVRYSENLYDDQMKDHPDNVYTILIQGSGVSIYKVCLVAEILRHRIKGLSQIIKFTNLNIVDKYLPIEEGLSIVEIERTITVIEIKLTTEKIEGVDVLGFHPPLLESEVMNYLQKVDEPNNEIFREVADLSGRSGEPKRGRGGSSGRRGARTYRRGGSRQHEECRDNEERRYYLEYEIEYDDDDDDEKDEYENIEDEDEREEEKKEEKKVKEDNEDDESHEERRGSRRGCRRGNGGKGEGGYRGRGREERGNYGYKGYSEYRGHKEREEGEYKGGFRGRGEGGYRGRGGYRVRGDAEYKGGRAGYRSNREEGGLREGGEGGYRARGEDGYSKKIKINMQFQKELKELEKGENVYDDFSFYETEIVDKFETLLTGPNKTIFEGAAYKLSVEIPENYPTEKPLITFYGVIPWHPNIANGNGNICIDMLNHWKSSDSVINALHCIQAMLVLPNPDSCLNGEAGKLLKTNKEEYERMVKENVQKSRLQF